MYVIVGGQHLVLFYLVAALGMVTWIGVTGGKSRGAARLNFLLYRGKTSYVLLPFNC